jgi:periplasmic divalent cation tolerance protein
MTECILVLTTMPADDRADSLAKTLVAERLAACVNIHGPMTREKLSGLEARLRELHPYELPEFIVLDAAVGDAYAAWIADSTSPPAPN